jgi:hypothetical protein
MGQVPQVACCSCSGKQGPANVPFQVINEAPQIGDKLESTNGAEFQQRIETPNEDPSQQSELRYPEAETPLPPPDNRASPPESRKLLELAPSSKEFVPASAQRLSPNGERKSLELAPSAKQLELSPQPFDTVNTTVSYDPSKFSTMDYLEMTKKQKQSTKMIIKDFVKAMVKGKRFFAVTPAGETKACFCALNRSLDKLQIRADEKDKRGRTLPLASIGEILVGKDKSASPSCDSLETPLDDLSVTLVLESDECLTFRMENIDARDKLASCLMMFSDQARTGGSRV